ncbi:MULTISPECIES: hypothetical protein [unclassified Synechocystis]|uniref:hypothetical protein n=1 Tax=unclassified Synechocystis TaxID=2640012 RepID=UPI00041A4018|nr:MULTISPECIES: hypothetical protein [unclassified Synechocystis]AIE73812.1 hypothetical protein D082_12840 [Synechocystis sp. PCC 6714]MCT0252368.1 hypothetical protein [Synechocystis sp. CS-94]
MAGLFGLFGKKAQYVEDIASNPPAQPVKKEAFFLETDDAKSLGNAEYMRTPIKIKRSFPKTLNSQGAEVVKEISALEVRKIQANGQAIPSAKTESTPSPTTSNPVNGDRRSSDKGLDMFRQMAKDLKK